MIFLTPAYKPFNLDPNKFPARLPRPPSTPLTASGPIHSSNFSGYLEGYSTKKSTILIWDVGGEEIVYDFVTLKRARFRFKEKNVLGIACGIELGASWGGSGYVGAFHFPMNEQKEHFNRYEGDSGALSLSAEVPLGDVFPGIGLGGEVGVSVFAATPKPGFAGIPSVDLSNPYYGAAVSLGAGASESFRIYAASVMFLNYEKVEESPRYSSVEQMAQDIRTGAHTIPSISGSILQSIRTFAADHLLWMYGLCD